MKKIIQHFTIIIFIFSTSIIVGQEQKIEWGPELEGKGLVEIIGEQDGHIFATQAGTRLLLPYANLIKIDKTSLQVVKSVKFDFSILRMIPLDFSVNNDKVQALVMEGKNFHRVIYDLNLEEQSNEIIEKLDKAPIQRMVMEGAIKLFPTDMISSFRSSDKSKVTVLLSKDGKKRGGTDLYTFDINDGLKQLSKTSVATSGTTKEILEDIELRSDGTVNLLIKTYKEGEKESKSKAPNYNYKICRIGIDSKQSEVTLPTVTQFWKNAIIKSASDNSIVVAAMTQLKPKGRPFGYQIIKIAPNGEIIFNKSHEIATVDNKGKLPKTFYLRNLIVSNNSDFVIIAEDAWSKTFVNATGTIQDDKFYVNNLFIDGFDSEGNDKWSNCIYRDVYEQGRRKLLSGVLVYQSSDLISMYYNTTEKNLEKYNSSNQRSDKFPSKKCAVLKANISLSGDLSFEKLSSQNKKHISTTTSFAVQGNTYFVGSKNNKMKKMFIGTLKS